MSQADRQLLQDALREFRAGATRLDGVAIRDAIQSLTAELLPRCSADLLNSVGLLAAELLQHDLAVGAFEHAIAIAPDRVSYLLNLASALRFDGRPNESIAVYRAALAFEPDNPKLLSNFTSALDQTGEYEEALATARRRVALTKDEIAWHLDAGTVCLHRQQLAQSIEHFRAAVRLQPGDATAHYKLGWALLLDGQFEQGWLEYEWRTTTAEQLTRARRLGTPAWDGSSLKGRTLLLANEGGLGDVLQFVRFTSALAERGAKVVVEAPAALHRLLASCESVSLVTSPNAPVPAHNVHLPIMSVPRLLGMTGETIPSEVPYVSVKGVAHPVEAIERHRGDKRVGLVWAGNRLNRNDRRRSCPPELFGQLAGIDAVRFYNLQQPDAFGFRLLPALEMIDCVPLIRDMADTAAVLQQLDLVITVDTAVAHLAGAMGRPVWILLPHSPDWRWQLHREDSAWYATATLLRQPAPGDWFGLLRIVRDKLEQFAVGGAT